MQEEMFQPERRPRPRRSRRHSRRASGRSSRLGAPGVPRELWLPSCWQPWSCGTWSTASTASPSGSRNAPKTADSQKEIIDVQQENAQLRQQIERLKSDPDAIEHEAREKLHYAKPGEVIYTLPAQPPDQPQPSAPAK